MVPRPSFKTKKGHKKILGYQGLRDILTGHFAPSLYLAKAPFGAGDRWMAAFQV